VVGAFSVKANSRALREFAHAYPRGSKIAATTKNAAPRTYRSLEGNHDSGSKTAASASTLKNITKRYDGYDGFMRVEQGGIVVGRMNKAAPDTRTRQARPGSVRLWLGKPTPPSVHGAQLRRACITDLGET
jgi:hypothetical protein